jgi:hypothetical protein
MEGNKGTLIFQFYTSYFSVPFSARILSSKIFSSSLLLAALLSRILHRMRYLVCLFYQASLRTRDSYLQHIGILPPSAATSALSSPPSDAASSAEEKRKLRERKQRDAQAELLMAQEKFMAKQLWEDNSDDDDDDEDEDGKGEREEERGGRR